jgi:hypothetical protein
MVASRPGRTHLRTYSQPVKTILVVDDERDIVELAPLSFPG